MNGGLLTWHGSRTRHQQAGNVNNPHVSRGLQGKATEQQEQVAELGRRVAELEVERADLASRNAMLQKLATIRGDGDAAADTVHERMGP